MSAAPKRGAQEEGVHSSSSLRGPSFVGEQENPGFPRVNYGAVQETKPGYFTRQESRDGERRSPLHLLYNIPSSGIDTSHGSYPVAGPEIRADSRDPREVRENKGLESNRDVKVEMREVQHQIAKPEECRVDEKESRNDTKDEVKVEKDVYGVAGSRSNWTEQHRAKKHPELPTGGGGGGMTGSLMGPPQVSKYDVVIYANPIFIRKETDGAMGENRVDPKGDKDRKRNWPESDKDRSDNKSNAQVGSSNNNNELKEVTREDKESGQWRRERKDVLKEKERAEEREKDHVDREGRSGGQKDGYQNEKGMADTTSMQGNFKLKQKIPTETWRNMEREAKERRKERDYDLKGERPEKRRRGFDIESEEGGAGVDLAMDSDKDAFSCVVQQQKRMLRPRGSPQVANCNGRFKSRNG